MTVAPQKKMKVSEIYRESGLMYIRFDAEIDIKPNGQKKIGGKRCCTQFSKLEKQPENQKGKYYSLLMGREFQPGKWAVLLDFDKKDEENCKSGLELLKMLNMDQYKAPKQSTPSGGFHYIFWVNAEQKEHIGSPTGITYKGTKYAMDVKFNNGLCNCAPSKIQDYGEYKWINPYALLDIPQLPKELFEVIRKRVVPKQPKTPSQTQTQEEQPKHANQRTLDDIKALLTCLSVQQMDDYATWIKLGMILKRLGAPMVLWEVMSKRSKKFQVGDCSSRWPSLKTYDFTIFSLQAMAKDGNMDMYNRIKPTLNMSKHVFEDTNEYPPYLIDTPYLTTKTPDAAATNKDQAKFKMLVDRFMTDATKKSLVLRSRYGSGKTTFMQRLIKERNPERVLFITYRQTLARDIMRNFGKLGFKNYLDSYDQPNVWQSPRLIVQIDSLMNLLLKNEDVMNGAAFDLNYDMIVLDESESLLCHFDEGTMVRKEIEIWNFFDELLKHCKKMVLMDGDVSERSLSFANSYGIMTYINNRNNEQNKNFNLICDQTKWETQLHRDLEKFYYENPKFLVCIVSQTATHALSLEDSLKIKYPHLNIKRLVGLDSGGTKKRFLEDINQSLETTNVFIYSPVIESGVDITIKVKKLYGILSCKSNSQRAYLQMLARCRNVEESRMDILNDCRFKINNNFCFWRYQEVMELNQDAVQQTPHWDVVGGKMILSKTIDQRRKSISVFNQVEKLNMHPSLFLNYLKTLALGKGMTFEVDQEVVDGEAAEKKTNYKLEAIVGAKDLKLDEFETLSQLKKQGKTTTEENFQVDKFYWQRYLVQKELDPDLLKEFLYDNNPLDNFLSLIDIRNHDRQDNLRSAKHVERTEMVKKLLNGLGFASAVDKNRIDRDTFVEGFVKNVAESSEFQNRKRINELFNLNKNRGIDKDMTPQRILLWANALLKPYGLNIKADHAKYKLEDRLDLQALIKRKNEKGRFFVDGENLLGQTRGQKDLFLDEATGEVKKKKEYEYDTSKLDKEVEMVPVEACSCLHGTCLKCKPWKSVWKKEPVGEARCEPVRKEPEDLDAKGRDLGYGGPPVGKENVIRITSNSIVPPDRTRKQAPAWLLNRGRNVDVWID